MTALQIRYSTRTARIGICGLVAVFLLGTHYSNVAEAQAANQSVNSLAGHLASYGWWNKLDRQRKEQAVVIAAEALETGWQFGYGQGRADVESAVTGAYSRGVTFPSSIFTAVARAPIRRTLRFSKSASSYRAAIDSHYASRIAERAFPFWLILANCFADSASCN